jgi:hypothetical protein
MSYMHPMSQNRHLRHFLSSFALLKRIHNLPRQSLKATNHQGKSPKIATPVGVPT